ncbi:hypothetical protein GOY07_00445 [Wolbachia endosymbiont of Litomosoides sigmodontis]|uniref:WH2 domain-containing protein n=1 Tax=Wolbachia endosymbiont of Litomosoides sigmodontis TaxID=80850 RepID=UPI0015884BB8|nr:WH2 domain-containing protein [Wolbachia endosymbiont of Litomosoides sigmodontis]QKX02722.1 hypothetical protein GOY07_00445 [Wolbachia endosymbiont of Litomosoides sigmodontis]
MRISSFGPLIAVLSLSVLSFTTGQYLPYVIAAVSGSSTIAVAPLAVFAVSMVIALISAVYLIKLAVFTVSNKKEGDCSSGKILNRSGQQCTVSQGLTRKSIYKNDDLKNELNKHISFSSSSPTCGTRTFSSSALPLSGNAPPPPPFSQISSTQSSGVGLFAGVKNTKLKKTSDPVKTPEYDGSRNAILEQIRQGTKLLTKKERDEKLKKQAAMKTGSSVKILEYDDSRNAILEQIRQGTKLLTKKERDEKLKKQAAIKDGKKEQLNNSVGEYSRAALFEKLKYRRLVIGFSDSESGRSNYSDSSGWSDRSVNEQEELREKKLTKHKGKFAYSNSQIYSERNSTTPSSGCVSDDDAAGQQEPETATPSSYWSNKKEQLQVLPKPDLKCVNLQKESKAFLIKQ